MPALRLVLGKLQPCEKTVALDTYQYVVCRFVDKLDHVRFQKGVHMPSDEVPCRNWAAMALPERMTGAVLHNAGQR
jgi:hypothetical protein